MRTPHDANIPVPSQANGRLHLTAFGAILAIMDQTLEKTYEVIDQDLAKEWTDLTARVRELARRLEERASGTELAQDTSALADASVHLADHVDRLHADVGVLLRQIDQRETHPAEKSATTDEEVGEVQDQVLRIMERIHEPSHNVRDVVKALFMWRDDPVERASGKKSVM